jgi:HD-GYP domain-containing protein (c-di-GMP phosphodiesterase class II)
MQKIKAGQGIAGSVLLSGRAEIVNDVTRDDRYVPGENTVSSMMCAPLKSKGKTLGVVNVSAETPFNYTSDDLKFFTTLVSQAAVAIDNARLYEDLKDTFLKTVHTLAETIEKRDPYTGGHTRRVMQYSSAIGRVLELDATERERLDLSAILHDIGKIGVSDAVLLKNGKLDDHEFTEIKKHPGYGEEILSYIKNLKEIIPGVKSHHERFDGRGYPDGLKGDAIDITARIIAVADSFDAMTTTRPYRKGLSFEAALEELKKCSGGQFDPAVVDAFFKAYESNMIENKDTENKDTENKETENKETQDGENTDS